MKARIKKRLEYVLSLLTPHGPITARAMFGGYGIYYDKTIFATLVGEKLYFRVDEKNVKDYELYASEPFVVDGRKGPAIMPYLTLPDVVLHDAKQLPLWIKKAKDTSLRGQSKKSKVLNLREK